MKTIKIALLSGIVAWTMSACQDWLTIYPTNRIVEEDFWEDKNDLEGVRYAIYSQMRGLVGQMAHWGDIRSDSYVLNSDDQTASGTKLFYTRCFEAQLERDSTNTIYDWSGFYRAINYCNKVLQHGPEVLERDKQFTPAEWSYMKAEVTGLRALLYFYLIRAYKDIPYSTKVVNSDTEVMYLNLTNQLAVLDSLILDVEQVKGQARTRFTTNEDTKGLMTNPAIYALLSDMYLWRASLHQGRGYMNDNVTVNNIPGQMGTIIPHTVNGDYRKAIEYADEAIRALNRQNETNPSRMTYSAYEPKNNGLTKDDMNDPDGKKYPECRLYRNDFDRFTSGTVPTLWAKDLIFDEGNSEESIFELQFSENDHTENSVGNSLWGNDTYSHMCTSTSVLDGIYKNANEDRPRDSRMWFSAWNRINATAPGSNYFCLKWATLIFGHEKTSSCLCSDIRALPLLGADNSRRNWIIYRLSDVMLQRAEAMAMLGQIEGNTAWGEEAMRFVNVIHRRWYCADNNDGAPIETVDGDDGKVFRTTGSSDAAKKSRGNLPSPSVGTAAEKYEIAVLNERQLEFLGEGKRWFDLVRFAERHNDGGTVGRDANGDIEKGADPREWTDETPINNGKAGMDLMVEYFLQKKYSDLFTTIKNRMKNRYGLYNVIYYKEISANTKDGVMYIEQNPVWNTAKYEK